MRRNLPYNPKLKERARALRKNMTPAEKVLWSNYLKNLSYRFLRQKPIGNYIADFYCPSKKLIIEVDGDTHSTDEAIKYDLVRTAFFNGLGLNVIRISNNDIYHNFNSVCCMLDEQFASTTNQCP